MNRLFRLAFALLLLLSLSVSALAAETTGASVKEMIDALPTVEEFKAMDSDAQVDVYNRTQTAYDAYMALDAEEKAQLEGAEETFDALFSYYNTLIAPADSGKTGSNLPVWLILAALAAVAIVPVVKKKG